MKICIPCTEADLEHSQIATSFDEAPMFAFWDPATDVISFESNPLAGKEDACRCSIARWARKLGAEVILSADLGRRAAHRLMASGVATLQAPIDRLSSVLQQFRSGTLTTTSAGEHAGACRGNMGRGSHGHQHREGACCGHAEHAEHAEDAAHHCCRHSG